jgi:serine/threonine protein kinase
MPKWLVVIDGPDRGQNFPLPEEGCVLIGSSARHVNVCLHDLYVARVHCEIAVQGSRVTVKDNQSPLGTLVNGQKVSEQDLHSGHVVRVGNSQLRLEEGDQAPAGSLKDLEKEEPAELPQLSLAQLHQLAGHVLGHFEIGSVLGRGSCAVMFRARDLQKEQVVALRVLPVDFPHRDQELQTLVRSCKTRMALRHPNLVTLLGAGKTGPYTWLATELVEGESLREVLRDLAGKAKIKWRPALRLALHMGRALAFAHQHRVFHGHITPQNILIQHNEKTVKLNDLLYDRALEGSRLQATTLEDKLLADLPYLAPELMDPQARCDELSDQYSLGAVIYARLTGRPPFVADTPEKTISLIRSAMPQKPTALQPSIPQEFQAVVLKMLARRQEDRYPAASVFLAELERLAGQRVEES